MKRWGDLHWIIWLALPIAGFASICVFAALDPTGYLEVFEGDLAAFELSVAMIPIIAAALAFYILTYPAVRSELRLAFWITTVAMIALGLACVDTGWGRDVLDLSFPEWWPGEDEVPGAVAEENPMKEAIRALMSAVVVFCALLFPFLSWALPYHEGVFSLFRLIWPTYIGIPVALLAMLSRLPRGLAEANMDVLESDGLHHSEVGEMFIYIYLFLYVLSLHHRFNHMQREYSAAI